MIAHPGSITQEYYCKKVGLWKQYSGRVEVTNVGNMRVRDMPELWEKYVIQVNRIESYVSWL